MTFPNAKVREDAEKEGWPEESIEQARILGFCNVNGIVLTNLHRYRYARMQFCMPESQMKLRDVKFMIPQIKKVILLNEEVRELEFANLEEGTIIIDRVSDKIIRCRLDKCKIISEVPLTIEHCHIDPLEPPENTGLIDKNKPHAYIYSCDFNLCKMPKGDYGNNYIMNKPQSSSGSEA